MIPMEARHPTSETSALSRQLAHNRVTRLLGLRDGGVWLQLKRDELLQEELARKVGEKYDKMHAIEEQRRALMAELEKTRKEIALHDSILKVCMAPYTSLGLHRMLNCTRTGVIGGRFRNAEACHHDAANPQHVGFTVQVSSERSVRVTRCPAQRRGSSAPGWSGCKAE